jgi:CRISPR/Cas system-associated exonuclease Cas4 (RecB family)
MDAGKFPVTSPTGLLDFEGCPKRWHQTKVLKKFKFVVTDAITHGNVVHEQLEKYVKYDQPLPEHLQIVEPIIGNLRDQGVELYAELECAIDASWKAVNWWNRDCYLRGKADLLGIKGDEAVVFDYKTGKRKTDPTQLKIYAAMLMAVLGVKKVKAYYVWLKTDQFDSFELTTETFDAVKGELTTRIARMKEAYDKQEFPARTSPLCKWCPVLNDCKEAVYYKVEAEADRKRR